MQSKGTLTKKKAVDMTEGGIIKHLVLFAIPLMAGNLFQVMYNMVDTWVIGNFGTDAAFSAVGTLGSVMNTLIGLFTGLASGAGILISQHFGAKDYVRVKSAVHTAATLTLILGIVFTVVGLALVPLMLMILDMPPGVEKEARTYLVVWMSGISSLLIYNMSAGILRSVGDTRRPFIFLIISAVVNTALDLLFVVVFGMGVAGVALATVIAQIISAVLVVIVLLRYEGPIRLFPRSLGISGTELKGILRIGIPISIQLAITAFSNVFVQSYVNFFGENTMGGWTAYGKIDRIVMLPMEAFSIAISTFVGQNVGAKNIKRAKRGIGLGAVVTLSSTLLLIVPVCIFAEGIVWIFNKNPEIIASGSAFIQNLTPFFLTWCVYQIFAGALRGSGKSFCTMVVSLGAFVGFRQLYLYLMTTFVENTPFVVSMAFPAGWTLASVSAVILFFVFGLSDERKKKRLEVK